MHEIQEPPFHSDILFLDPEPRQVMHHLDITIEDHVVPQLLTSALEAYEIRDQNHQHKLDKLETFGLLWGYVIPEREDRNPRIIATVATVETSALRKNDSVKPDINSLKMKMEFVKRYWPHLEVVGTFHSHPYESLDEVKSCKGWQASTEGGDTDFWPYIHKELFPTTPYLGHLIVTITKLSKKGWANPKQIHNDSGFELSMGSRKLWITSYGSEMNYLEVNEDECFDEEGEQDDAIEYEMMDSLPRLDIPSLPARVIDGN